MLNSISVSVSDDDCVFGRTRFRVRQKRKRQVGLWRRRAQRAALRYWRCCFSSRLSCFYSRKSRGWAGTRDNWRRRRVAPRITFSRSAGAEESAENLNQLDLTTHRVNGTRVRCLEILGPEQIGSLEFPGTAEPKSFIKKVVHRTGSGEEKIGGNYTLSRFNLFTGYLSLHKREESHKVSGTALVHCGFYSENGGFKISDEDKSYMQTCDIVVSTCAFGGGDDLYQPIGMTEASLRKLLGHRLFPEAKYSIWVDSKSQFRRDPIGVLEALLWRRRSILVSEHGARSSLYDEAKAVVKKNKATPEEVEKQLNQYRQDGIPDDKRINGKKALAETSVIVREHTPLTNRFMCPWFNEVVRFTSRDQLSFLRRLKMPGIHMLPVCTRKDLVNSIGHRREVKPLERLTN